jgi:uncharacterized protein with HEPN domain
MARKIEAIERIVAEADGDLSAVLADDLRDRPAVFMHLIAIAEQIGKLKEENAFEILGRFAREDLRGMTDIRNLIAHDYEGIDLGIVEMVIREGLPKIRQCIEAILVPAVREPSATYGKPSRPRPAKGSAAKSSPSKPRSRPSPD